MKEVFIGRENLGKLIGRWAKEHRVYVPVTFEIMNHEETPDYEPVGDVVPENMHLEGAAPAHAPKSFLFYPREVVAKYPSSDPEAGVDAPPTIVVGPRGCDVRGLQKFDKVYWSTEHFTEEYDDPFYIEKRKNTYIVSVDCTAAKETCFCTKVGGGPYPEDGFDLNLAPIEPGFVLTVGSEKGERLLAGNDDLLMEVRQEHQQERTRNRNSVAEAVNRHNAEFEVDAAHDKYDLEGTLEAWMDVTKNCVACSACNRTCPTCTCFLLVDQRATGGYERTRNWDTCLSIGFARTGGGGNSRAALAERLRNRLRCKFEYSRDRYGLVTCTGCGRCIDVCMGRIDMREAIKHVLTENAKA
ncbi:MAG: 4Fe-4S dicluster domain-containing protein [Candidatus Eisenbacteria bacterium]